MQYLAELKKQSGNNGHSCFIARLVIEAANRGQAVHKAQLWYWARYRGRHGPAHTALTVNDPYHEVRYGPEFNCGAKCNRLLDSATCARVLAEADGELVRDERPWRAHHPPGSVRRVKRRRDFGVFIAPNIRQMKNGVLYYRLTSVPQKTRNGRRLRKRKYRDVRLETREVYAIADEIERRGLVALHTAHTCRNVHSRSLDVLRAHLAAL